MEIIKRLPKKWTSLVDMEGNEFRNAMILFELAMIPDKKRDSMDTIRFRNSSRRDYFCQHGILKLCYNSGELRAEISCRDYHRHGPARWYYESGILEAEISYENDIRHGKACWFSDLGELKRETFYCRCVEVPDDIFFKWQNENLTIEDILDVKNLESRRILLMELGSEKLFKEALHLVLDETEEEILVRLLLEKEDVNINILKVKCASTNKYYFLKVPPEMKNIKQAKAWTFDLREEDYNPIKET